MTTLVCQRYGRPEVAPSSWWEEKAQRQTPPKGTRKPPEQARGDLAQRTLTKTVVTAEVRSRHQEQLKATVEQSWNLKETKLRQQETGQT
ncbi:hypothetical protein NDU88_001282 [Pleurodeles waltl]|uniref:Uncharacterized protein n=1 Tax=Pleurodeles waltl TaxID=8319 RepID=A0AAV7V7S6_PLEWA|nr:hypothetical protein NDU88_001282 [Pleurodeles waltl]